LINSVYAVNRGQSDKEYEYSRVSENSKLFVIDKDLADKHYDLETEFLKEATLYSDNDFIVKVSIPASVCKGKTVKMVISVEKLTDSENKLTVHSTLQVPGFLTDTDAKEIPISLESLRLKKGEKFEKEYWMLTQRSKEDSTVILVKSGTGQAFINDIAAPIDSNFKLKVMLTDIHPRALVDREIGRISLENREMGNFDNYIRLADITLIRTSGAYIIEKITENNVKNYIGTTSHTMLRNSYLDYFVKENDIKKIKEYKPSIVPDRDSRGVSTRGPEIASGVIEIPLGANARKGEIKYSGEVVHGLGKGNVYVQIGYESIAEDPALGANAKTTIYGNVNLFRNSKKEAPLVDTAVKVLNDKGSFVVAAKLEENVDYLVLSFRWVAIRFPAGNELGIDVDYTGKSIIPETPTVVLDVRESHFFGVRFENMDSCSLMYELTEAGSGEITTDGVYTAPNKEGVFEIRIYCTDIPVICAYAYAIVKKKATSLDEEAAKEIGN